MDLKPHGIGGGRNGHIPDRVCISPVDQDSACSRWKAPIIIGFSRRFFMAEAISLPTRTTIEDVIALVKYLATKPMGATVTEAKSIIDNGHLDARKLNAYKYWGLVEEADGGRLKLKELGRTAAKDKGAHLAKAMREVIESKNARQPQLNFGKYVS
jgi:hypothetical protein